MECDTVYPGISFNAPMIAGDGKGLIVVSDDSNSVFADSRITGCAITVTAAA